MIRGGLSWPPQPTAKYDKATACLAKDRAVLLTFYDFPAEHWKHLRTTNPIESTFATVRLRTIKTKGCLSRKTALAMVFKLCQSASKKWRRLDGSHQIAGIIQGVKVRIPGGQAPAALVYRSVEGRFSYDRPERCVKSANAL